jgi:hypothetical protein
MLMLSLNLLKNSSLTLNLTLQHGVNICMTTRPSCLCVMRTLLAESELTKNWGWHHMWVVIWVIFLIRPRSVLVFSSGLECI